MADEAQELEATFGTDVTVQLSGGFEAVLDGDPPWGFLTGLSKVTSPNPSVAAEALDYLNSSLPAMVRSWTVPAKVGGSMVRTTAEGEEPKTVAWLAGEVPPTCSEGLLSVSTRLVVELALKYGQAFKSLPKAQGGS